MIDEKNERLKEMELKNSAISMSFRNLMEEKDKLHQAYSEGDYTFVDNLSLKVPDLEH